MATNRYVVAMLVGIALVLASCASDTTPQEDATPEPSTVQMGSIVSVDYAGSYPNGTLFDSSEGREPLQLQVGAGQTIPGFEAALVGMEVGETKEFTLEPADAYGEYNEELIVEQEVPLENFGDEDMSQYVGQQITVQGMNGQPLTALVLDVSDVNATLEIDANHPLAGETLVFEVTVRDVNDAPPAADALPTGSTVPPTGAPPAGSTPPPEQMQ